MDLGGTSWEREGNWDVYDKEDLGWILVAVPYIMQKKVSKTWFVMSIAT